MDRAHRIGQKKVVQVFRLITTNTMEQKMVERQAMKLKLDSLIIQKGRVAPKNAGLQKDEMIDMVNYGADGIFQVGDQLDDRDIDTLIREGEERAMSIFKKANSAAQDKLNLSDFTMNSMNLYQFEDVDYAKKRRAEEQEKIMEQVKDMII
jgi:SWI/SNF-related matrix-associated actin-dependent regulator of chromatin subfamily A member 5